MTANTPDDLAALTALNQQLSAEIIQLKAENATLRKRNRALSSQNRTRKTRTQPQSPLITAPVEGCSEAIDRLIKAILKIPGNKILTLASRGTPFTIDLSKAGVWGYDEAHEYLFRAKLATALYEGAGLTIRQFLPVKVERTTADGKTVWIPKKNVYGIVIHEGTWHPVSKAELRLSYGTDHLSGKPIPIEPDIYFMDFPVSS